MKKFLTSKEVAEVIGLSLGTTQKMIDGGVFKFFVTSGGHRRVLTSSVKEYLVKRNKEMGV